MDSCLAEQEELFMIIMKVTKHFKEVPKSLLTKGYLQIRMNSLDEYWQTFKTNHFELVKMTADMEIMEKEVYPYFKNKLFLSAEERYIEIKGVMVDEFEKISNLKTEADLIPLITCSEETFKLIKNIGANYRSLPESCITKLLIQSRISVLDEYWKQFKNIHFEIIKMTTVMDKEHPYIANQTFLLCESEYISTKDDLQEKFEKLSSPVVIQQMANNTSPESLKQLKIEPSKCSKQTDNQAFDNIQNFVEQAGQLLQFFQPSEKKENTEDSVKETQIKKAFKRSEISETLNILLNQKSMTNLSSNTFKELLNTTQKCLYELNEKVDTHNWDMILIHILSSKLDMTSREKWEKECDMLYADKPAMLHNFIDWLNTYYKKIEKLTCTSNQSSATSNYKRPEKFCYECSKFGHYGHECQYHE